MDSPFIKKIRIDKNGKTAKERKSARMAATFELHKGIGAIPYLKQESNEMKPIIGSTIKREQYTWITCDSCRLLSVNGIPCHQTGCPNSGARWDGNLKKWVKL